MNILEIIAKKRDKQELDKEEIIYFVNEYTKGEVTDYQAAALVMAIYINGMTKEEITNLSIAMAHSGEILDLSILEEIIVDKHSTGGVGDKVTLILAPIVASLGVPVAKMSGRGLGFTGGTIDKLESIPGYQINVSVEEFIQNVEKIGISLIGQTLNLAPADKKLYALRDTISCTDNIPLIASSIMSKKIASGASKIVLNVTVGSGAFMKTKEEAQKLARTMIEIGKLAGKETICILSDMDQPLGYAVGNSLEMIEAIESLKGKIPKDIEEIVLALGSHMIALAGKDEAITKNEQSMKENIENGKAYEKFVELVKNQGGDTSYLQDTSKFQKAKYIIPVISKRSGYVKSLNAKQVGEISCFLGAGRIHKEDHIDYAVGVILEKKKADYVEVGDTLAFIHANDEQKAQEAVQRLESIYELVENKIEKANHIIEIMT